MWVLNYDYQSKHNTLDGMEAVANMDTPSPGYCCTTGKKMVRNKFSQDQVCPKPTPSTKNTQRCN